MRRRGRWSCGSRLLCGRFGPLFRFRGFFSRRLFFGSGSFRFVQGGPFNPLGCGLEWVGLRGRFVGKSPVDRGLLRSGLGRSFGFGRRLLGRGLGGLGGLGFGLGRSRPGLGLLRFLLSRSLGLFKLF